MPSILFFIVSLFFIFGTFAAVNKILFILFLLIAALFLKLNKKFFLLAILALGAGYFYSLLRMPIPHFLNIQKISGQSVVTAEVVSEPKIYDNYQKFIVVTNRIKILTSAPIFYQIEYGDIVKLKGNFETLIDKKQNLQGIFMKGFAKEIKKSAEHKTILKTIIKFKKALESKLALRTPIVPLEIISGLLYGKNIALPELKSDFKNAGLSHLTAMSGYNLTVISSGLFNLLKYFNLPKFLSGWLAIPFLVLFVILSGAQGSIIRAFIMSAILLLIKNSGRIPLSRNILLGAGLLITLINPVNLLLDWGFQLSFLAAIGIIYLAPAIEEKLQISAAYTKSDIVQFLKKTASETIGAQIMVLPLIWYYFGELNLLSIFSNLTVLPLIPFFMLIGFLTIIFIFIWPVSLILSYSFNWLAALINFFSRLPVFYFNPPLVLIIFTYLYLFYLIYQTNKNHLIDFHLKF
jgi:competence protein ComEC